MELTLDHFDFELPEERIARYPLSRRDDSRLLVVRRSSGTWEDRRFKDLPSLLSPGDRLVVNETKVIPAKLLTRKQDTGGKVELLIVEPVESPFVHRAMATNSRSLASGARLWIDGCPDPIEVVENEGDGFVVVRLPASRDDFLARHGAIPIPPYLGRRSEPLDVERYQTVFADAARTGSVAAPTAGLHFTPEVLSELEARSIFRSAVTLHVGPGTFLPIRAQKLSDHVMHQERFEIPAATVEAIANTRARGGRVVAVGTTVVRTLESVHPLSPETGSTRLFIKPGFEFRNVDIILTNFHLPKSTLVVLVSAFLGRELTRQVYEHAVKHEYRFFSYGDAMVIL